jgi:hypothetical protein
MLCFSIIQSMGTVYYELTIMTAIKDSDLFEIFVISQKPIYELSFRVKGANIPIQAVVLSNIINQFP